jgi:hypothetical protein
MRSLFEKKISDFEEKAATSQKSSEEEGVKLGTRISKLQENMIKMRKDL